MSFAKYFEDNMEIIEERFALRQQENEHTPIYRVTQEVGSNCNHQGGRGQARSSQEAQEKEEKNRVLRLWRDLPLY